MKRDIFRRSCAEFLGTFALVFFGCGVRAIVGNAENIVGIFVVHLTFGLTVAAMIYLFSYLSAAVFNPAITLGFAVTRRLPWRLVLPYWLVQVPETCCAIGPAFLCSTKMSNTLSYTRGLLRLH